MREEICAPFVLACALELSSRFFLLVTWSRVRVRNCAMIISHLASFVFLIMTKYVLIADRCHSMLRKTCENVCGTKEAYETFFSFSLSPLQIPSGS